MKRERKIKAMYAIGYTLLVVLLFLGTRCESHPKITSPEHDSKYLESLAECITCETDLVIIEKLAREYEIAYRKGYNGAMATKFTELMVPVREMATARLDAIRAEDDYLKAQQAEFNGTLNDLDRAWQMDVATPEAAYVMCSTIKEYYQKTGRKVGFKPAGGINTVHDALVYYTIVKELLGEEWLTNELFRLGTSRLANLCLGEIIGKEIKFF